MDGCSAKKEKKKKKPQCNSRIQPLGKGGREGSK
jgi:hypothetical protein